MSGRRRADGRRIMGPQSALTDYLASHNIVAADIARNAQARRDAAAQAAAQEAENATAAAATTTAEEATEDKENDEDGPSNTVVHATRRRSTRSTRAKIDEDDEEEKDTAEADDDYVDDKNSDDVEEKQKAAKKKKTQAAAEKIKKMKAMKKRKRKGDDSDAYDDLADMLNEVSKKAPLPGQMDYCGVCDKRFTVTPYTRADAKGNLLCPVHSKELEDKEGKDGPKKKKPRASTGPVGDRRKKQSAILDGANYLGAKSLLTLCIEKLAANIDLADDLGSLPDSVVDNIARMVSKRRLLKPQTLELFARPDVETLNIYTGSKLATTDLIKVFQTCPNLKHFKLYDGIAFKDEVMDYIMSRNFNLESLYLHGANLISEAKWLEYLTAKGEHLKSLKITFTDKHVTDTLMLALPKLCPNLERLKIAHNEKVTGKGIRGLSHFKKLEHLSIYLKESIQPEDYDHLLAALGPGLQTFSVRSSPAFNDFLLSRIMTECRALKKLRLTGSEEMTDAGFAQFFEGFTSNPGLEHIDLEKCRHLDSETARSNPDDIGLGSKGFVAMMEHSGETLRYLKLHACRFITVEAFMKVFGEGKVYPELRKIDLSNCEMLTDAVVEAIYRACPMLHEIVVFACFKVKDARVPSGRLLVGVSNAVGMKIEGE